MNDFYIFAGEHWFLTIVLSFPFYLIICSILKTFYLICNRILRTIKVCLRGWPPEHLDADGDFK